MRHGGIESGDGPPLSGIEPLRDPAHLRMIPAAVRISDQLPFQIAGVEAGEPRRAGAVAAPVQAVADDAGIGRAGLRAAQRNQLAGRGEAVARTGRDRIAGGQKSRGGEGKAGGENRARRHRPGATSRRLRRFRALWLLPAVSLGLACKPPPDQRQFTAAADAAAGRAAIERVGCGTCHMIPGLDWPRGRAGPPLEGLADRALIAGRLPNRPDLLAAFVRDAPALVPGSAMPAMPLTEREARDVAAYLYEMGEH